VPSLVAQVQLSVSLSQVSPHQVRAALVKAGPVDDALLLLRDAVLIPARYEERYEFSSWPTSRR